ncbi:MAG: hypothetical protein U0Y10_11280 [Spirosomataceae bacterium]
MDSLKRFLLTILIFPHWGLGVFAQTMTADDIKEAEKQGMLRYRVSGTYTEKVTALASGSSDLMNMHAIVGKSKMSINGSKIMTFSGIGFMNPINNDSPDLCKYEMQIDGQVSSWISCNTSGSVTYGGEKDETVTYTQPGQGSCTTHSLSKSNLTAAGIENYVGVNFCFFNTNKWMIEVGTRFKNPVMTVKGEDQRCEAGKVIKTPIDSETEYTSLIGFSTSPENNGKISFDGKKFTITYSFSKTDKASYHGNEIGDIPYDLTTSGIGTIEITPIGTELEAFIEPVEGTETFKKEWLPQGPDVEQDTKVGNQAKFWVYVQDPKNPARNLTSRIKEVRYSLENVSRLPGFAMNFPSENASTKADLQLHLPDQAPNPDVEKLTQIVPKTVAPNFHVMVTSLDYGAYGSLKATVVLDDGTTLTAKDPASGRAFFTVPYRSNADSRIADSWKDQQKATDLADMDDEENDDELEGNKYKGDGFTLYEEYRGFIENKKHIRTDAHKKDLMVCDKVKDTEVTPWQGRSQMGIDILASLTGFVVHSKFRDEEYGKKLNTNVYSTPKLDTLGLPPFKYDKCLNFNSLKEVHDHDQLGLLMLPSPKELGYAAAFPKGGGAVRPVGSWHCLVITKDFDPTAKGYSSTMGDLDKDGNIKTNPGGKAKIITDEYAVTVAHELLHCCNVRHHGDKSNEGTQTGIKFSSGKTLVKQNVQGVDSTQVYMQFEREGYKNYYPVIPYWDDAQSTPILATDTLFKKDRVIYRNYAVQQGNHSGVEDCVMRYDVANVIYRADGNYYLIKNRPGTYAELTGTTLCNTPNGTGVNAFGFLPRPRYGKADAGRGNCKAQVVINDKYH